MKASAAVRETAAAGLVIVVALLLHFPALQGWWLYDDPQLLLHALRVPAIETLFDPDRYALLATHTFTPLLPLSFRLDYALGGLDPAIYYAHQLVMLVVAALLLFLLMRRYVAGRFALSTAIAFLSIWPTVYAARTLMIRHYVEGLVFALAALILWSHRDAGMGRLARTAARSFSIDLVAAFLYLVSMLQKELYAPIPLILILQSRANGESWTRTIKRLVAPSCVALIYLFWRARMVGAGGFGGALDLYDLIRLPWTIWRQIGGGTALWGLSILGSILLVFLVSALRRLEPLRIGTVCVLLTVAILPVLPLASSFEWRYGFSFGVVVVVAFGLAAQASPFSVRPKTILAIVATVGLVGAAFPLGRMYERLTETTRREGEYVWRLPPAGTCRESPVFASYIKAKIRPSSFFPLCRSSSAMWSPVVLWCSNRSGKDSSPSIWRKHGSTERPLSSIVLGR